MSNFKWKKSSRVQVKRSFAAAFEDQGEDGEEELSGSLAVPAAKREPLLHLEDPETRFRRLKAEGIALAGEERFWQAIHTWNQALEIHGEDAGVLDMKCQALIALHEWDPAIEAGKAAVAARQNWHEALQTLGRAHVGRGDVAEARACFQKAFHLRPDDKELREEDLLWCHGLYIHKKAENEALELASGKVD